MADDTHRPRDRKLVTEEASIWLERLERALRGSEGAALREWLRVPLHQEVIVERCKLWHGPEILAILGELIPLEVPSPRRSQHRKKALAVGGAIFCVGVSALFLIRDRPWPDADRRDETLRIEETFRTPVGATLQTRLPDGTTLTLNTTTRVNVNYALRSRDVVLVKGEASFDVTPVAGRPFRLRAGPRTFETESGQFSVRRFSRDEVELTVAEGEVRVLHDQTEKSKTPAQLRDSVTYTFGNATLHASEGGVIGIGWQNIAGLEQNELEARLAWQRTLKK